jgi:hypothetical protein
MKKLLTFVLALSTLSSTGFAQTCRGFAACSMVAGVSEIRGRIAMKDIEKRFTRDLMRVSASNSLGKNVVTDEMVNKIRPGDKIIITYSVSNHLNVVTQKVIALDEQIAGVSEELRNVAIEAHRVENNTIGFRNPQAVSSDLARLKDKANTLLSIKASLEQSKAMEMKKFSITRSPVTRVILDANDNIVGHELKAMLTSGKSIYAVQRVPNVVMKKIASASRNGWILAATAVALGLVTMEELTSGRISRNLDAEFERMNR